MQHTHPRILFATQAYHYLKNEILEISNYEDGQVDFSVFPDGERYQCVVSKVSGKHIVLIGGTQTDSDMLEMYDLACALVAFGARSLTIVIPYFAYSTMERSVRHGEVVTAKTRARLLSAIPEASYSNRVFLLDLHSEGLPYYFEMGLPATHLYAKDVVARAAQDMAGGKNFVLASTDAGRAKWVESLANDLGVEGAFVFKKRISGNHTEITGISAKVEGKKVVIYDDMIRTGGSLVQAAKAYKDAGATEVYAVCTHGVFVEGSLEKILSSGYISKVAATNSHPKASTLVHANYKCYSIAGVLAKALTWY